MVHVPESTFVSVGNLQETDHASRRRPGRRGRWWRSAVELRMSGLPESANRTSRTSKHPGIDRDQRRRRPLVPDQCVSRSSPATDRDAAASPQGRKASSQSDIRRHPDQRRNRCGRGPVVDARRLALHDLCARPSAFDPQGQQHLQCAEREECAAPADRGGQDVRADTARRLAVRHRDCAFRRSRQERVVSGRQGSPRQATVGRAIRWGFASATRQPASISIFSPPAPM